MTPPDFMFVDAIINDGAAQNKGEVWSGAAVIS
jgi:hypothetical protein